MPSDLTGATAVSDGESGAYMESPRPLSTSDPHTHLWAFARHCDRSAEHDNAHTHTWLIWVCSAPPARAWCTGGAGLTCCCCCTGCCSTCCSRVCRVSQTRGDRMQARCEKGSMADIWRHKEASLGTHSNTYCLDHVHVQLQHVRIHQRRA